MVKKRKWLYLQAGYTVEAAFVVPVVLGMAFVILFVIFYLHDQAVLQGKVTLALCQVAEEKLSETEAEDQIRKAPLFFFAVEKTDIKKNVGQITGSAVGRAKMEIPVLILFMNKSQEIRCDGAYFFIQPEQVKQFKQGEQDGYRE